MASLAVPLRTAVSSMVRLHWQAITEVEFGKIKTKKAKVNSVIYSNKLYLSESDIYERRWRREEEEEEEEEFENLEKYL